MTIKSVQIVIQFYLQLILVGIKRNFELLKRQYQHVKDKLAFKKYGHTIKLTDFARES